MITAKNPIAGRCCAMVIPRDSGLRFPELHRQQCSHKVAVVRTVNDKGELGFCKIHDPEARARRDAARSAEWDARTARQNAAWNRGNAERNACKGMADPVAEVAALREWRELAEKFHARLDLRHAQSCLHGCHCGLDDELSTYRKLKGKS